MDSLSALLRDVVARLPGGRRLKAELDQCHRQREQLRHQLDDLRLRLQSREPDPDVLRQVLPLRQAALRQSSLKASPDTRARQREAEFVARSSSYRDALAAGTPPANGEATVIDGLSWWVPKGDSWHLPLEEILQTRELAQGRLMLDVGANVGTTSIPRVILGDFDHVFAAEPDPVNYDCLVRNVVESGTCGSVLPDRVAIGDRDGELSLQQGTSRTHHLVSGAPKKGKQATTVPCLRLDSWVERLGIDLAEVSFVKVDTQGWEPLVLIGAPGVLTQKHIAWQVEFSPSMLRRSGSSAEKMCELIRASFTHFIDVRGESGPRSRPTSELVAALARVGQGTRSYTNLLLYNEAR